MNTRGVVYFNFGTKCLERLFVSLHSLRKFYDGPVAVINVGDVDESLPLALEQWDGVEMVHTERVPYRALVNKVHSLQYTPFDLNVFLDADTLVVGPIDEFFEALEGPIKNQKQDSVDGKGPVDLVWCHFCAWSTKGRKIKGRMEKWRGRGIVDDKWIDNAIEWGPAVNVGTFAYRRGASWLREWMELTKKGGEQKLWIPDEQAAQICMPRIRSRVLGPEWGVSVRYGTDVKDKRVIHYHGNKHNKEFPLCDLWRSARDELIGTDKLLARATLVIAVNKQYLNLFKQNYETWTGFRDRYPKLIIYNGINPKELKKFLTGNYKLVEWKMEGVSPKEEMITSFVTCAPKEVETPFWIKLDVDTRAEPEAKLFGSNTWYDNNDLVSHRWSYTKPGKWLCTLEEWGDKAMPGKDRLFSDEQLQKAAEQKRFGHPRIQSFACLHRTEFTRYASSLIPESGRMPVPSHDTFLWYVAERGGYKIRRVNIRKWGFHHGSKRASKT